MLFSLGHNSFSFSQKAVQRNRGAREAEDLVLTPGQTLPCRILVKGHPTRQRTTPFVARSLQDIYSTGLHPLDELVELFRRILAIGVQTCHVVAPGGETPLHPLPNRLAVPLIPLKGVHVHLRVFLIEGLRDPRGIICAAVVDHVDGVDDLPRIVGYSGDDAPDGFCGVIGRNEDAKGLSDNY